MIMGDVAKNAKLVLQIVNIMFRDHNKLIYSTIFLIFFCQLESENVGTSDLFPSQKIHHTKIDQHWKSDGSLA